MTEERRRGDPRIQRIEERLAHLHDCQESMKVTLALNTEVTEQVRDILASFRILGSVSKWMTAIVALIAAVLHLWQKYRG